MPITRREIVSKVFTTVGGGYDADEVDAFLDLIADTLELRDDALHTERQRVALLTAEIRRLDAQVTDLRKAAAKAENADAEARELVEQAKLQARMVIAAAREEAQNIVQEAREQAELIVKKALEQAASKRPLSERIAGFALRPAVQAEEEPEKEPEPAGTAAQPQSVAAPEQSEKPVTEVRADGGSDALPEMQAQHDGKEDTRAEDAKADGTPSEGGYTDGAAIADVGAENETQGFQAAPVSGYASDETLIENAADGIGTESAGVPAPVETSYGIGEETEDAQDESSANATEAPAAERREEAAEAADKALETDGDNAAHQLQASLEEPQATVIPFLRGGETDTPAPEDFWKPERPAEFRPRLEIVKPPRPEDVLEDDGFYPSTDWLKNPDSRYDDDV